MVLRMRVVCTDCKAIVLDIAAECIDEKENIWICIDCVIKKRGRAYDGRKWA